MTVQIPLRKRYCSDFTPKRTGAGSNDSGKPRRRLRKPAPVSRIRTKVLGADMKIHWEG
jgi:hypothetical protein